jgi:hypothetical protein
VPLKKKTQLLKKKLAADSTHHKNGIITHISNHKQQQAAPAKKRCISLVVMVDTWVVMASEQDYQTNSEKCFQLASESIYQGV